MEIDAELQQGIAHQKAGQLDQAAACYRAVLLERPEHPLALHLLGVAELALGRAESGIALLRQSLGHKPDAPLAWTNLGVALVRGGQRDAGGDAFRRALALNPALPAPREGLAALQFAAGLALQQAGNSPEAAAHFREAATLQPDSAEALTNLGIALDQPIPNSAALGALRQAVRLRPDMPEVHNNLGMGLMRRGRVEEAIATYRKALALRAEYPRAHHNLSVALLLAGQFAEGWREYEWRWAAIPGNRVSALWRRPWLGQGDIAGRRVLLRAEQGFGDTLQFVRYVPELARRGARVVLQVQKELLALLSRVEGAEAVVAAGGVLPGYDLHCPLLSLPLALGTTEDNIPAGVPYVTALADRSAAWAPLLAPEGRRIGIAWAGNPGHADDARRSIPFAALQPLFDLAGCRFHVVQPDVRPDDAAGIAAQPEIVDLSGGIADFADTAAIIDQLDLVITVDTAIAHLAGAMGKPVWILLPFAADWRWMQARADSPWYPTARLFRQDRSGNWPGVISQVAAALSG